MNYTEQEQKALQVYWNELLKANPGFMVPVTENGLIAHPDYNARIQSIAQDEVIESGYMLGVKEDGSLSEDAIARINEMVEVVLIELGKTPEERSSMHQARTHQNPGFNLYEYRMQSLSNDYNLYVAACKAYGIEPQTIYQNKEEIQTL